MSTSANFKKTALHYSIVLTNYCTIGIVSNYAGCHLINLTKLANLNPLAAATASIAVSIFQISVHFLSKVSQKDHLYSHSISQITIKIAVGIIMVATYVGACTLTPKAALVLNVSTLIASASAEYFLRKQLSAP